MGSKACGIVVAPHVDDADGDIDLGVNDALLGQSLHHAPGGQLVVLGAGEQACDGFKGVDEAGEIGELVKRFGFRQRDGLGVVARAQLHQRGGQ